MFVPASFLRPGWPVDGETTTHYRKKKQRRSLTRAPAFLLSSGSIDRRNKVPVARRKERFSSVAVVRLVARRTGRHQSERPPAAGVESLPGRGPPWCFPVPGINPWRESRPVRDDAGRMSTRGGGAGVRVPYGKLLGCWLAGAVQHTIELCDMSAFVHAWMLVFHLATSSEHVGTWNK